MVNVVRIECILGKFCLLRFLFSFLYDLFPDNIVFLEHLNLEDVTDFDIMGRYSIMENVGWEGHSVFILPIFWLILSIKHLEFLFITELESTKADRPNGKSKEGLDKW